MIKKEKKGQIEIDEIIWWIIAIIVLVLVVILYFTLKSKGINIIDYIKNLVKFGK